MGFSRSTARFRPISIRFLRRWTTKSSSLPVKWAHPCKMGTKSRQTIYGSSVRAAAEQARAARKEADRLACQAWNKRMFGLQGSCTAVADDRRRSQRRLLLCRNALPRLRYLRDRGVRYRSPAQDNANPRARKDRASCPAFGIQRFERYEICHR